MSMLLHGEPSEFTALVCNKWSNCVSESTVAPAGFEDKEGPAGFCLCLDEKD